MTTPMRATVLLTEQHDEIRSLFAQLQQGQRNAEAMVTKLATNLVAHMVIEEELFYPAVIAVTESLVLEGFEEHAIARFALEPLVHTEPSERKFQARVKALKEIIEHHAGEEEKDMFRAAEKALGESSEGLCAEMKALYANTQKNSYQQAVRRDSRVTASTSRRNAASAQFEQEQS